MDEDEYYYGEYEDEGEIGEEPGQANFKGSDFIPLDDLVYAPLHALAQSNQHLRVHVVEAIKSMGTLQQNGQEETVQLNNMNIAYQQIRPEGEDGYSVDDLQLQVPLLSIVPITNLNVERAHISFSTEVKAEKGEDGKCAFTARICAPEQRESDFLPRVSYHMKITSLPATEGIMRLADMLNASHIAKKMDTVPVTMDGNLHSEEQKSTKQEISMLKSKIKKLRQLYQKIEDLIAEQEKLLEINKSVSENNTRQFDKDKYRMAQSDITDRIMEYQDEIMDREIELGLSAD